MSDAAIQEVHLQGWLAECLKSEARLRAELHALELATTRGKTDSYQYERIALKRCEHSLALRDRQKAEAAISRHKEFVAYQAAMAKARGV